MGKPIAFVGKVSRIKNNIIYLKTADESEVKVNEFRCNQKQIEDEDFLEIRGIVNKDFTINFE